MGEEEVSNYLTYLAVNRQVTSSTQNLALCSIVFMYKHVFERELTLLSVSFNGEMSASYRRIFLPSSFTLDIIN